MKSYIKNQIETNLYIKKIKENRILFSDIPKKFLSNKTIAELLLKNGHSLEYFPDNIKNDFKLAKMALKNYFLEIKYIPEKVKDSKIFWKDYKGFVDFQHLSKELSSNKQFVKKILEKTPSNYDNLDNENLRIDIDIINTVTRKNKFYFLIDFKKVDNEELIKKALKEDPYIIKNLNNLTEEKIIEYLKINENIIDVIDLTNHITKKLSKNEIDEIKNNRFKILLCEDKLLQDKEFILENIKKGENINNEYYEKKIIDRIKQLNNGLLQDKEFVTQLIISNHILFKYLPDMWKNVKSVFIEAIKQNSSNYNFGSNRVKKISSVLELITNGHLFNNNIAEDSIKNKYKINILKKGADYEKGKLINSHKKMIKNKKMINYIYQNLKFKEREFKFSKRISTNYKIIKNIIDKECSIKFIDKKFKKNKELMLKACKCKINYDYIDNSLKNDKDIVLTTLRKGNFEIYYKEINNELKNDEDIIFEAMKNIEIRDIRKKNELYESIPDSKKNNMEFIKKAIDIDIFFINYVNEAIRKEEFFIGKIKELLKKQKEKEQWWYDFGWMNKNVFNFPFNYEMCFNPQIAKIYNSQERYSKKFLPQWIRQKMKELNTKDIDYIFKQKDFSEYIKNVKETKTKKVEKI